jgi:hypothetical protein
MDRFHCAVAHFAYNDAHRHVYFLVFLRILFLILIAYVIAPRKNLMQRKLPPFRLVSALFLPGTLKHPHLIACSRYAARRQKLHACDSTKNSPTIPPANNAFVFYQN